MVIAYQDESEDESTTVIYSYYSGDSKDKDYVNPWLNVKPEDYYPL